jgi:Domain of unknown function (DUF4136)
MRRTSASPSLVHVLRAMTGVSLILLTGCLNYPDADERYDDEIIYTRYKEDADFGEYKTFAVSTEVIVFEEDDDELEKEPLDQALADQLIAATTENMENHGYTKVDKDADPDLGVTISVVKGKVTGYYGSYWGSYWGYPYWGYYYPYYYTYSYDTSTLILDTVDLKNAPPAVDPPPPPTDDPDRHLDVIWTGLVYGVLEDSPAENLQDALEGIDKAFKQSLYFQAAE